MKERPIKSRLWGRSPSNLELVRAKSSIKVEVVGRSVRWVSRTTQALQPRACEIVEVHKGQGVG